MSVVTSETELGNLFRPLKLVQVFGIWLTGDYRMQSRSGRRATRSRFAAHRGGRRRRLSGVSGSSAAERSARCSSWPRRSSRSRT